MSDRNVALALSRSGLSSPAPHPRGDRRVEVEQRAHGVADVPAVEGLDERALERRHLVAQRRLARAPAGRSCVIGSRRAPRRAPPGRFAGRKAACRLAERLDRELGAGLEPGAPAVDADGHAAQPRDGHEPGFEVQDQRGVAVDAEDERPLGPHRLEVPQPSLAHVAEAGVVVAALGVVVVGDDGRAQAGRGARGGRALRASAGRRRPCRSRRPGSMTTPRVSAAALAIVRMPPLGQLLGERVRDRRPRPTGEARSSGCRARP